MKREVLNKAIYHTLKELNISNIISSIQIADFKLLKIAHDSIHEFMYIAPLSCPPTQSWLSKSAFLTYHFMVLYQAHRSLLEALAGYYNAANILLRSVLELMLKGALWECLAHKRFRDNANIIEKKAKSNVYGSKRSIVDWLNDVIRQNPRIERDLEETSGAIFDKIFPLFDDRELRKLIPRPKIIIEQLHEWGLLDPYNENEIYDIYQQLSQEVHVIPDRIDIGRRLLSGRNLFEVEIIPNELERFLKLLHKIMDIGIVLELNVLSDWIIQNDEVKEKLRERVPVFRELELRKGLNKLLKLVMR